MDIEQGILLEGYAQFVSKVEQRPELTGEDAKKWLMGDLMQQGFQVSSQQPRPSTQKTLCCTLQYYSSEGQSWLSTSLVSP